MNAKITDEKYQPESNELKTQLQNIGAQSSLEGDDSTTIHTPVGTLTQTKIGFTYDGTECTLFVTLGPGVLHMSAWGPQSVAAIAILKLALKFGVPTFIYRDVQQDLGYHDLTAEWFASESRDVKSKRQAHHAVFGEQVNMETEHLEMADLESLAQDELL